jgi:phosphoribosyl 1,2-cyclic phosphodiesterase
MKFYKVLLPALFIGASLFAQNTDSLIIRRIHDEALADGHAYTNLAYLCKKIGPRLSGSLNAQKSVEWTKKLMENYGFDRVYLQEIMVPVW